MLKKYNNKFITPNKVDIYYVSNLVVEKMKNPTRFTEKINEVYGEGSYKVYNVGNYFNVFYLSL